MLLISLSDIRILDVVDVVIVMILVYQLYKLLKGTIAFNIFIGVMILYGIWYAVSHLGMRLLTFLLGPFVGFGVLILIIIFQPEVRQFLLMLGNNTLKNRFTFLEKLWGDQMIMDDSVMVRIVDEILIAITHFSNTKTGALIVVSKNVNSPVWNNSGMVIDAQVSSQMLKTIFQKGSPMHDGAAIIVGSKVYAVSVILPISESHHLPEHFGLRHRAALGVSEKTNAVAFVVSEENGDISYCDGGELKDLKTPDEIRNALKKSWLK